MTPQSPRNFRILARPVRVRSSPAPAKCKKSIGKDVDGEDHNANSQQPAGWSRRVAESSQDLMALRETWKYKAPCSPLKLGSLKCLQEDMTDHISNGS